MEPGDALAEAARRYEGVPFRLHGRGRDGGVDCVGLLGCATRDAGLTVRLPRGYGLRNLCVREQLACFAASGFVELGRAASTAAGDVVLTAPGPAQHHLLIALGPDAYIHAHAGLRRVVISPAPLPCPILRRWRAAPPKG